MTGGSFRHLAIPLLAFLPAALQPSTMQAQERSRPAESPSHNNLGRRVGLTDPPLIDLAGYRALLARHRGKALVVNFWATWCEPCRSEYPMLVELARQFAPRGLHVVGVSFDNDADMNLVRRFLARHRPAFPNCREKPGGGEGAFVRGVSPAWSGTLPMTLFFMPDGRLFAQFVGTRPRQAFEGTIRQLLAERAPSGSQNLDLEEASCCPHEGTGSLGWGTPRFGSLLPPGK